MSVLIFIRFGLIISPGDAARIGGVGITGPLCGVADRERAIICGAATMGCGAAGTGAANGAAGMDAVSGGATTGPAGASAETAVCAAMDPSIDPTSEGMGDTDRPTDILGGRGEAGLGGTLPDRGEPGTAGTAA